MAASDWAGTSRHESRVFAGVMRIVVRPYTDPSPKVNQATRLSHEEGGEKRATPRKDQQGRCATTPRIKTGVEEGGDPQPRHLLPAGEVLTSIEQPLLTRRRLTIMWEACPIVAAYLPRNARALGTAIQRLIAATSGGHSCTTGTLALGHHCDH